MIKRVGGLLSAISPVSRICPASVIIFHDEPTLQSLSACVPNRHCLLAAAAYDRWLVHQGKPQKYGTQYRSDDGEAFRLEEVDPATTDEERAEWDVPPLAEAQRMAEHMRPRAAPRDPSLVVTFLNPGIRFEVRETDEEPADAVPVPAALPDGLTPCRLGKEYGATTSEGQVALTWRRCRWRAEVDEGVPGYDPRHASPGNITIGLPGETHCKLVLFAGPETCWLVEGDFGRDELVRIATSLPA